MVRACGSRVAGNQHIHRMEVVKFSSNSPSGVLSAQSIGGCLRSCDGRVCAGQTGSELSSDLDQRAFSFFNSMLDVVMEASAQNSPSTPHHGKSLGAELQKVVDEAFAFMRKEFEEQGDGEQAVAAGGSCYEKIMSAAREHIHVEDVQPCSVFRRAVFWHWANLEYGCSADLGQVCI